MKEETDTSPTSPAPATAFASKCVDHMLKSFTQQEINDCLSIMKGLILRDRTERAEILRAQADELIKLNEAIA